MNSNFLSKVYGVNGYRLTNMCHKDNKTILKIERKHVKICCATCGNIGLSLVGSRMRDILGVPSGLRKTVLRVRIRRYRCRRCGHVWQDSVPFASGNRHYSHRFAQYVVELLKSCTVKSVASLLRISWDTVKRIHKEYLRRRYSPPPLKGVRNIGIDEFSVRRGSDFRTIVVDLDTGRIVHVGKGRGGDALLPFWRRVKRLGVRIRHVATDLSAAFIASVLENAPGAKLVFDHFHVVKLMNEALDDIRRTLYRHERSVMRRRVLLGTRYLLLRNAEDVLDTKYRTRLDNALAMNEPLSKAYYMKEALRGIWMQPTKDGPRTRPRRNSTHGSNRPGKARCRGSKGWPPRSWREGPAYSHGTTADSQRQRSRVSTTKSRFSREMHTVSGTTNISSLGCSHCTTAPSNRFADEPNKRPFIMAAATADAMNRVFTRFVVHRLQQVDFQ